MEAEIKNMLNITIFEVTGQNSGHFGGPFLLPLNRPSLVTLDYGNMHPRTTQPYMST